VSLHVQAAPPVDFDWIASRTGCAVSQGFKAIEAVDVRAGRILGMVGYDMWTENSAQMHVAVEKPSVIRALLVPAFSYLFDQCGKGVAVGVVPSHSTHALRFDLHVGFREVYRIRDGWAVGDDLVILEMRKEECRWLRRPARKAA
jgi:hypothetical protein